MKNNKEKKNDIDIEELDMRQIETVEVKADQNLNFIKEDFNPENIYFDDEFHAFRRRRLIVLAITFVLILGILSSVLIIYKGKIIKNINPQIEIPVAVSKDLVVTVVNDKMLIRSKWGDVYDIAYEASFGEQVTCGFKLKDIVYLDKLSDRTVLPDKVSKFANIASSINPISFTKNTFEIIGPQNGWDSAIKVEKQDHGLTEKDIGSVFKDKSGRKFTIVQIINKDSYLLYPSSEELAKENYAFKMPASNLHYVSGFKRFDVLAWSDISRSKLAPAVSNVKTTFSADDEKADFSESNYIICADFKVNISYDILNIVSAVKYLESNAGLNRNSSIADKEVGGKYLSVSYTYVFSSNAGCTVINDIECFTDMQISKLCATAIPNFAQKTVYIPNTKKYSNISKLSGPVEFTKDFWNNSNTSLDRIYLFGKDDNSRGICTGCITDSSNVNSVISYDAKRNYIIPNYISKPLTASSGKKYQFINFIVPFEKNSKFFKNTDLTSVCWFFAGDDIYLFLEAHKAVNQTITLPDYMNGMNVENYDLSNGVEVNTITVENSSVSFKSDGSYGYAVLKLTKQ